MNWTQTRKRLIECDVDAARLPEAWQVGINLREANLSEADLSVANLYEANLSEADLSEANLSWADLSEADLSGANLSWADLSEADLSGADLSGANLSWANLSGANLSWANLSGATGPFTIGYFGRHHAIAAGGYISIGCKRHTYDDWLKHFEIIGTNNDYTADEIADYGAWIKLAVARQRRIEAEAQS